MKKVIILTSAFLAAICLYSGKACAQNPESGYFLDNYTYGYRINPAIMPDNNFIAIGIGNISAGIESKVGVSSFLYPGPDGGLVTGLHKSVSPAEFLSKFSKSNKLGEDINVNLLSFGIRKDNSMSTVEINVRENFQTSLPRDILSFLKEGSNPLPYDLSPLSAGVNAVVELALGHSRRYDNLVFGLRAKLLFGAAGGDLSFDRFSVTSNQDVLGVSALARMKIACEPLEIVGSSDNPLYVEDVSFALKNLGVAGFGMRFDLGAKWYINDNLSATLGINDLGAMSWKYNNVLTADFNAEFNGLKDVNTGTDIGKAFDDFLKEVEDKAKVNKADNTKELTFLPFSVNAGVRYRMPFYERLSVGALVNFEHSKYGDIVSSRAGATVTPINWLSLTGNFGVSNYGTQAGCMASLTLLGINIFAGFDCYCGKCSNLTFSSLGIDPNLPIQQLMVPLNAFRYKFSSGITIQFGKRRADYIHNGSKE